MFLESKDFFENGKKTEFWLVLSGWASRWMAHIWVFKYLEENNLIPSEIAWTSIGAFFWSLYAFSYTSLQMEEIIKDLKYVNIIDFDFKTWLISWKKAIKSMKNIFWNSLIEDAKIPLRIIATDIDSWEKIVFEKWKVVEALRASMWVPWLVAPYRHDWRNLVDWGIMNNLPIQEISLDKVIAVSVARDIKMKIKTENSFFGLNFNKTFIWISYQILKKSIDIMKIENEKRALDSNKKIILVHPKFTKSDYDFKRYKEVIKFWYNETKKMLAIENIK